MPSKRIEAAELKELAAGGERVELRIGARDLARLSELLVVAADDVGDGGIDATLKFDDGPEGYPRVRIDVDGKLPLRCQRCLDAIDWPVSLRTQLTVVGDHEEAGALAEPFDCVVMESGTLLAATMIEDEILATLPMAPFHDNVNDCASVDVASLDNTEQSDRTHRPFESLATMVAGARDTDGD